MAGWSFAYAISNGAKTAEASAFWKSLSVVSWSLFFSVLLHFILVLTKTESRLSKKLLLVLIYLPSVINIILFAPFGVIGMKQYKMVRTAFGWANSLPPDTWLVWHNTYILGYSFLCLVTLLRWWRKLEPRTLQKRQATLLVLSIPFPFLSGVFTDVIPNMLGIESLPRVTILFLIFPVVTLYLTSKKYGLFLDRKRPLLVLPETDSMSHDKLRVFEMATGVILAGAGLSFMVRYFGLKGAFINEFLVAGTLIAVGTFVKFIPVIAKNHTVQNTLFLAVGVLGTIFLSVINRATGATTIWAVFILFLLVTIILGSKIHAYIFAAASVVIQILYWIYVPELPVIINGNEYVFRIFIIISSFVIVRYLTGEHASKIEGYQRFAKEQATLEKISSSFISITEENAKEKIDDMLEMSNEILEFDHAYLVSFSEDYEDATIDNTYVKGDESESLPFYAGMKVKTATLPMVKSMIDRDMPLLCENVADLPVDEAEEQRRFFMSRDVYSFFALPIKVDEEIKGVIVIEYFNRSDRSFREGRLYYLRIIANILGDARKKILYEEKIYDLAYFDETTKLANRNMLKMRLDQLIHDRTVSEKIAILDIELENLRMIKDTFGHGIGEQIMVNSATILKNLLRNCCEVARTGEGDFVVVLTTIESNEQVEECATKMLKSLYQPISTGMGIEALYVVPRVGISVYPKDGRDADTLLKNADLAGYEAKNTGEKIVFYSERLESLIAENTLFTNRLFNALQNEEFFLEYQPQISCETGKTVGFEALLRWTTDGNKRVGPDRFIPILEQTGLIYDVGLWVLEQALQEQKRLVVKGFPSLQVSVNLSVVQFQEEEFVLDLIKVIEKSGVDPHCLELEITESFFSDNPEDVVNKLYQLKALGISIAIDDFGKGYSSLNRLKLVPFDKIKIDKSIIDYIDLEKKAAPLTEIIILLARTFKASVTAEGVETSEQAEFLKSLGCDEIQGYYYSKPLSAEALEGFLKEA
jgi:diguanylate cyclase (GGDEF)-like protein